MKIKKDRKIDVMWVGLSHKKEKNGEVFLPLGNDTNSGKVILEIEKKLPKLSFHRTNLVKFAPTDGNDKLRYPTISEMENDFPLLLKEIIELKPKIVFLLGSKVSQFVLEKKQHKLIKSKKDWRCFDEVLFEGIYFVSIFHPSYVYVYKRKKISEYVDTVYQVITDLL